LAADQTDLAHAIGSCPWATAELFI